MSGKHTPGPWRISDDNSCTDWRCDHFLIVADAKGNDLVIQIGGINERSTQGPHAPLPKEAEANARLIAAAPQMLAALKQLEDEGLLQTLIDLDSSREEDEEPIASDAAKACRAAIAKATGAA